jgi:hypothetical protein
MVVASMSSPTTNRSASAEQASVLLLANRHKTLATLCGDDVATGGHDG